MKAEHGELLRGSPTFRFVSEDHFAKLVAVVRPCHFDFGDLIVKQGDPADAFYVLVSGRVRVFRESDSHQELSLKTLQAGDEFGEAALTEGGTRQASVRCSSPAEVLRLERSDFLALVEQYPDMRRSLELRQRWKTLHNFLYEFSQFGRLPPAVLQRLMENLTPVAFSQGDLILREGDPAGPMYIVQQGRVRVFSGTGEATATRAFLRAGDFFGELSILTGAPRAASAQAVTGCQLLSLSPLAVQELNRQFPEFARLMEERRAQYQSKVDARIPLDFSAELLPAEVSVHDKVSLEEAPAESEEEGEPFADDAGHFVKRPRRIRRIPWVRQVDEMDCGAASLAMVCGHYGRQVSLARIRQLCHTAYDGTSLRAICSAATELGLAARALKVSRRHLPLLPLPAIIHWEGNHWLVLFDVQTDYVRVADPATGIRKIPRAEFADKWSGYTVLFDYTEAFEQAPQGKPPWAWLLPYLAPHRTTLLQCLLLALAASALQLLLPLCTQVVVDKVIVENNLGLLRIVVLAMLAAGGFMLAANLLHQYLLSYLAVRIDSQLLDFVTRRLLTLPMSYFHSRRTGDIQRRLEGARQIRTFMMQDGIGAMLATIQLAGCLVLMALYSLWLFGVFMLLVPLYLGLMYFSMRVLRPLFADLEEAHGKYSSHQIDAIKGIEAVKAAAAELNFRDRMIREFLRVAQKMFRGHFIAMTYESAIQMLGLTAMALFLWVGGLMVIRGEITIGGFVAFNSLVAMASAAVLRVLGVWDQWQWVVVQLNRLNDLFEQEPEQGADHSALKPVPTLEGRIELRQVGFRYGGPESPVILKNINLEIAPGRLVAIVGRSGSGKTTLAKLIAGLIEPTEGVIAFDHLDMKTLNYRDLRRQIGMVLQENHMFDDTILQNIAFGDPEPDFERAIRAAQIANAHDFIMQLPLGYETRIGETGLALSGGQKQRIAIARAVYPNPPLLIFDEATSALDTESEKAIQNNLTRMMAGRTCLVIAHRLSTIRDAGIIVVLEKGQIAETGSHDELVARRGLYFYLSSQQLGI